MLHRDLHRIVLGLPAFFAGVGASVFVPAFVHIAERREYYAASGHSPNMDPGLVWYLQAFLAAPLVVLALCAEAVRLCLLRGRPLSVIAAFLFGAVCATPAAVSLLTPYGQSWAWLLLQFAAYVVTFYVVRSRLAHSRAAGNAP